MKLGGNAGGRLLLPRAPPLPPRCEGWAATGRNALIMQPPCPPQPYRLLSALGDPTEKKPHEVPLSATDSGRSSAGPDNLYLYLWQEEPKLPPPLPHPIFVTGILRRVK